MKKLITLTCVLALISGCASRPLNEKASHSIEEVPSNKTGNKVSTSIADGEINFYGNYSEGYAWIDWISSGGLRKVSLINKKGKIVNLKDPHEFLGNKKDKLVGFPITENEPSGQILDFYEGYAWYVIGDDYYVINNDLEIVEEFHSTENKVIKAFGGKYYLAMVTEEDFDHREQYLAIYDCEGNPIVRTGECDPDSDFFYYLGNGIFSFVNSKKKSFIITTTGILKEYPHQFHPYLPGIEYSRFKEDSTQLLLTSYGENYDGKGETICIIDEDGTIQTVNFKNLIAQPSINSKGLTLYFIPNHEGKTVNTMSDKGEGITAVSEDITKKNERYQLNDHLSERLVFLAPSGIKITHTKSPYQFNENGIVPLSFIGADGKDYIGIFDSKFNQIGEMIQGKANNYCFEDGLCVVYLPDGTVAAYNEKGEKEFEFPPGTINVSPLSDGVYTVQLNSNVPLEYILGRQAIYMISTSDLASPSEVCYITKEGKRLFKEVTQS